MRWLAVAVIAAAIHAVPASAADIDPKGLVLTRADLPPGYQLNRQYTYVLSNARFSRGVRANEELVARSGRVTGYRARYDTKVGERIRTVMSQTDVFRRPEGARVLLLRVDALERKYNARRGLQAYGRERANIGGESWVYWSGYPGYYVFVAWRHGRFLGTIHSWGVGKERTLALARTQQRRIAAAVG